MMDWNWGWGTMMSGGIGMLVFWGLLIGLVILGIRVFAGTSGNRPALPDDRGGSTPLEILQRRYAEGEITREEYEAIRRDIGHT